MKTRIKDILAGVYVVFGYFILSYIMGAIILIIDTFRLAYFVGKGKAGAISNHAVIRLEEARTKE